MNEYFLVPLHRSTLVLCSKCAKEPKCIGTLVLWCKRAKKQLYFGTLIQMYVSTLVLFRV